MLLTKDEIGLQKLFEESSPFAFHNSINRSQEVDREVSRTLVQKWTSHIKTLSNRNRLPTSPLLSSIPLGPLMEPHTSDGIINDVFNWLFDYSTPFLVMWIHDKTVAQTILVAQVIAGILNKLDKLSASFFSGIDGVVNYRHIIPTLAHQLARSRPEVRDLVGRAVAHDGSIFNLEIETQLKELLCDPILAASESGIIQTQGIPHTFVIHGLENYDEDQFQSPFLQDFVDILHLLRASKLPHRLLIIGQHTPFLQSCTSKPNMRQTVLERPITASFWFGKEAEISSWHEEAQRREEDLRRREEGLRRKEEDMRAIEEKTKNEREELESELKKIECEKKEWNQKGRGSLGKEVELEEKDEDMKKRSHALQLEEEESRIRQDSLLFLEAGLSRREDELSGWEGGLSRREDEVSERKAEMGERENELKKQEEEVRQKGAELTKRENELSKRENELSKRENELSKREEEVRRKERDPGPNQRQDPVASTSALSIEAPQLDTRTKSFKKKLPKWLSPRSEGHHSTPVSPADVDSNFMPLPTESEPPDLLVLPLRGIDPRKLVEDTFCAVDALQPFCNGASMLYVPILSCYLH